MLRDIPQVAQRSACTGSGELYRDVPQHDYQTNVFRTFSELPRRHRDFFEKSGADNFFSSLAWYRNYASTVLAPQDEIRILVVEDRGAPKGALLMAFDARRRVAALGNFYTPLWSPIVDPQEQDVYPVIEALVAGLQAVGGPWRVIDLRPLPRDATVFAALMQALERSGYLVDSYFCFRNLYLEVAGRSFEQYLASRTSRLSKTAKRTRRKLEADRRLRCVLYRSTENLDEGIALYERIYKASWKIAEPYPDFMRGLIRTCAEEGSLRLGIAYLDDEPAAAQIWIVAGKTASIYKMAYDERFAKDSAGTLLSMFLMQHVIDVDRAEVVDYLSGDDAYKRDWMSHCRDRHGIVAFNPRTLAGLAAAVDHYGRRLVRNVANLWRG